MSEARLEVERVLVDAVRAGVTPGLSAVVASARPEGDRLVVSAGKTSFYEDAPEVDQGTIYDLASLTKVLSTTLLVAAAVDAKKIDLDEAPWPAWPEVTVRHALHHNGGLLWWKAFFEEVPVLDRATPRGRKQIIDAVLTTPPTSPPGEVVYSDLGFIALGALVEDRLGDRLDRLFEPLAQATYGETELRFVSISEEAHHPALQRVAPTERCPWRGRVLHGQVHDDNCYAMGGIAGHAGLFGTVLDLEKAGRAFLAAQKTPGAMQTFIHDRAPRCLGFDIAEPTGTTGGVLSEAAFGHLGFTGTSLWMDPAGEGALYGLLTNRVHPDRNDANGIRELRINFHIAAKAWLDS